MVKTSQFIKKTETRKYHLQGKDFVLEVNSQVFSPSSFGLFFAKNIKVHKGDTVIDIGSGSGFLGVLAAKLGGKVSATDTDIDAVKVTLENAKNNRVRINAKKGAYFGPFRGGKFDVIIANLPQKIITKLYKDTIGEKLSKTINGGKLGNEHLLKVLDLAKKHMHSGSRLYISVNSATDYKATIRKILSEYSARLVDVSSLPMRKFIKNEMGLFLTLNKQGKITIYHKNGAWTSDQYFFELRLK